MRRSSIVLLGLLVLGVAEVKLLTVVGGSIGFLPLFAILGVEAALGGWLAKHEGAKAWASLRDAQRDPAKQGAAVTDAALVMVGAFLLILPGFLSDAVGLVFLLPVTRGLARRGLTGLFGVLARKYGVQTDLLIARSESSTIVEGSVEDLPPQPPPDDPTIIRGEIEP